jgi:succinate dehydrogenase/fumarate reductase-like Fe-S protein
MREEFVGAVAWDKIGRFRLDPRDTRSDADDYELVGDDSGVFGCMSLLAVTTSVRRTCHRRHRLFVFAGRWLWKG